MIKVGIIGFGKMGQIRAHALQETERAKIVSVYDVNPIDNPPATIAASETDIINNPNIDAIFICTPNFRNKALAIEALNAGKHVFCEKPPAFHAAEVEEIRKAEAATNGKKLMYGFNHRLHTSIVRMKQIIDSGEMGSILWMRGRYGKEVDESFLNGWRANKELSGGGIMLDQGIHMLDLFLHLGGEFDEVKAFVSNLYWKIEGVEDNVFAILRSSKSGICASLHSTMTQWRYLFSLEVFLEGGALILNGLKTSSGAYGDENLSIKRNSPESTLGKFESEENITFQIDHSWLNEINHFIDSIQNDTAIAYGNSQSALDLMQVMDQIYAK